MAPGAAIAIVGAVAAVAIGFAALCLVILARSATVRYLPRWGWALIICLSIPWGGIAFLIFGATRAMPSVTAAEYPAPPSQAVGPPVSRRPSTRQADIEVQELTKHYGEVTAVDELSFAVRPGHVTGFLGPNGAGKTTTMRVMLGLAAPTAGTALIGGRRYAEITRPLHEVGSLLDASAVHGSRTAWVHLLAIARSNGIGRRRVTEVLELTGLDTVAGRRIGGFSLGMKQRLGIAAALLGDPGVLIFDEPVNGLDPEGVRWIRQLLRSLADEGRTVLVSSHLMSEMAQAADRLVIIGRGRLLADTTTERFVETNARRDVLVLSPRGSELANLLAARGATVAPEDGGRLAVTGMKSAAIGDLAAEHGIAVHELVPRRASLEDAYLDLTSASTDYRAGQAWPASEPASPPASLPAPAPDGTAAR